MICIKNVQASEDDEEDLVETRPNTLNNNMYMWIYI